MDHHHLFISLLITITFNEISSEQISFNVALMNDLNITCIQHKNLTTSSAVSVSDNCIQEALRDLYERKHELNYNEERIKLICTTDITKECNDKQRDIVLPCLPENTHEIVDKMINVNYQLTVALCANDAEYYKTLLESTCETDKKEKMVAKKIECEVQLETAAERHLITYFSTANCQ
uniref:DUF19 domain-containing protein n=1 Tax=Strigamia maritima TaxID=126957 RepID=T1J5E5_STRMM